ncbi:MAG: hypothetical protein JJ973_02450 [Rhodospirillales bacterium]|nr:hypothetical protein [Rhodospirillales bacterium]
MAYLVALWMFVAAVGGGVAMLRVFGLLPVLSNAERTAFGFVLGIGLIGWLAFFAGVSGTYAPPAFIFILVLLTAGLYFARQPAPPAERTGKLTGIEWLLIAGIGVVGAMDLAEALVPATDADSMAYHFETPRQFLFEQGFYAIPRAIDGVTQLLQQITYGVALSLGGKPTVPVWAMMTGWALGGVFYVLARRHVSRAWAMAGTLVVLTTPAIVYAGGSGQVEVRAAAFALLGAYAAAVSVKTSDAPSITTGWILLAGAAVGFFIGAKLTGLIFAAAVGISLIGGQGTLRRMALFSAAAAVAGFQWYAFNWQQTGDPLYPLLWQLLDLKPGFEWNATMAENLERMWAPPDAMPRSLFWFFAYPVRNVFAPLQEFGALRTGLGPTALAFVPFACVVAIRDTRTLASPVFRVFLCALLFYIIWFITTPSTLVRLLVPVYPLLMLALLCALERFTSAFPKPKLAVTTGVAAIILMQLAGQALFTKNAAEHLVSGAPDRAYLAHNVSGYEAVEWINGHLDQNDRILVTDRGWLYLLDVPYFMAHPTLQHRIFVPPGATDIERFVRELRAARISHVVVHQNTLTADNDMPVGRFMYHLEARGCAVAQVTIDTVAIGSRTLPGLLAPKKSYVIFKVSADKC